MSRQELFVAICALVGSPPVTVRHRWSGWPGLVDIAVPSGHVITVALHVSTVGSHARRDYELRFQNPADSSPVRAPNGSLPILLGLYKYNGKPVLVGVNGGSRVGRHARFSVLFNRQVVEEAVARGWAVYTSTTGENIYAFNPALFPVLVEMFVSNLEAIPAVTTSHEIANAAIAAGLIDDDSQSARERARRAGQVLVRHHAFGKSVVALYDGQCAMCGLNYGMVIGAHIYPVPAPGSQDKVWNGLALCHNHHAAFDAHKIWVNPISHRIALHPSLIGQVSASQALKAFVDSTYDALSRPNVAAAVPKPEMFKKRYQYFEGQYRWAD